MENIGTCGHCNHMWGSVLGDGKPCLPRHIPTCPEATIMAVCTECFDKLESAEIVEIVLRVSREADAVMDAYETKDRKVTHVYMTPIEHQLMRASIVAWVTHMKSPGPEKPYELVPLEIN